MRRNPSGCLSTSLRPSLPRRNGVCARIGYGSDAYRPRLQGRGRCAPARSGDSGDFVAACIAVGLSQHGSVPAAKIAEDGDGGIKTTPVKIVSTDCWATRCSFCYAKGHCKLAVEIASVSDRTCNCFLTMYARYVRCSVCRSLLHPGTAARNPMCFGCLQPLLLGSKSPRRDRSSASFNARYQAAHQQHFASAYRCSRSPR